MKSSTIATVAVTVFALSDQAVSVPVSRAEIIPATLPIEKVVDFIGHKDVEHTFRRSGAQGKDNGLTNAQGISDMDSPLCRICEDAEGYGSMARI
jgi:hypothetical protein